MKPVYTTTVYTSTAETKATINGTSFPVSITTSCYYDDLTLDDVIGDAEDRESLERRLERGDLMIGYIVVKARAFGLEGSDVLGGCYISSDSDVDDMVRDYGMVDIATDELVKTIISMANDLAPFQGGEA